MAAGALLGLGIQLVSMWATPQRVNGLLGKLKQSPTPKQTKQTQMMTDAFVGISSIIGGARDLMSTEQKAKINKVLHDLMPELEEHVDRAKALEEDLSR